MPGIGSPAPGPSRGRPALSTMISKVIPQTNNVPSTHTKIIQSVGVMNELNQAHNLRIVTLPEKWRDCEVYSNDPLVKAKCDKFHQLAQQIRNGSTNGTPVVSDYGNRKLYPKSEKKAQPKGVGTCLHELFVSIGINPPCVTCGSFAALMDSWGIEGCRTEHREEIIRHLDGASREASWLDWTKVILAGYVSSNQLLNEAIRRAEVERDKLGESLS